MSFDFTIYENAWNLKNEFLDLSPIGLIVSGIVDFDSFSFNFQSLISQNSKIIQLSAISSFVFVDTKFKLIIDQFKNNFNQFHYEVLSIFLKESLFNKFFNDNIDIYSKNKCCRANNENEFDENLYYISFNKNNYSRDLDQIQKVEDIKIKSSFPQRYFYGFKEFSDLLNAYIIIIKDRSNWPVFALPPLIIKRLQCVLKNHYNIKQNLIFNSKDLIFLNQSKANKYFKKLPLFIPDNNLYYIGFILKEIDQSKRMKNVSEMYKIKNISDVQISHIYNQSKNSTIRTFFGFDNKFRCLLVYDYFQCLASSVDKIKNDSIVDVILVNNFESADFLNKVHYYHYYIEVPIQNKEGYKDQGTLFTPSILYSLNYVDFINSKSNFSTFYGFDNQEDFEFAKQIFSSQYKKSTLNFYNPEVQLEVTPTKKRRNKKLNQNTSNILTEKNHKEEQNEEEQNNEKNDQNEEEEEEEEIENELLLKNLNFNLSEIKKPSKQFLDPNYFSPNQKLIYFYFIENQKARENSAGKKLKLTSFGIKKCEDIQRYKKITEIEETNENFYTFFGFLNYNDMTNGMNLIKSKSLSEGPIQIYENTEAFNNHQTGKSDDFDHESILQSLPKPQSRIQDNQPKSTEINSVRVDIYQDLKLKSNKKFYFFNQLSVPMDIQIRMSFEMVANMYLNNVKKDVISHYLNPAPYSLLFIQVKNDESDGLFDSILKDYKIKKIRKDKKDKFMCFEESFFTDEFLESFNSFLKGLVTVVSIDRKVYYHGSIVTVIYYDFVNEEKFFDIIHCFFRDTNSEYDCNTYPLKNSIIINECVVLQKFTDFTIILKEIVNFGIKPIQIFQNSILYFSKPIDNYFWRILSFICFENEVDKMKVLNHLNKIIFKGEKNILKYKFSLHYVKVDSAKHSSVIFQKVLNSFRGVLDIQTNALSIENPMKLTYIGFDTLSSLRFFYKCYVDRIEIVKKIKDANFFKPRDDLQLYIKVQVDDDVDVREILGKNEEVMKRCKDFQIDCFENSDSGLQCFSFIGFCGYSDMDFVVSQLNRDDIIQLIELKEYIDFEEEEDEDDSDFSNFYVGFDNSRGDINFF